MQKVKRVAVIVTVMNLSTQPTSTNTGENFEYSISTKYFQFFFIF